MKILNSLILFLIMILSVHLNDDMPPIPKEPMSVFEELGYMVKTDLFDRKFLLKEDVEIDINKLKINDSIRLSRVINLDKKNLLISPIEKYYAAFIYFHNGGRDKDSTYYLRAIELCNEIIDSDNDDELVDTVNLKEISNLEKKLSDSFSNIFESKIEEIFTPENCFVRPLSNDTCCIISTPVKKAALSLKGMAEINLARQFTLGESIDLDLDKLDDPSYIEKAKLIIKNNIMNTIYVTSPNLVSYISDKKRDKYVDEFVNQVIEMLNSFKKRLMEEIQKHPEKFK